MAFCYKLVYLRPRLLDALLEVVGGAVAVVMDKSLDMAARAHATLLEMEQLAPGLLGVHKSARDTEQFLEREQRRADGHEDRTLERTAPARLGWQRLGRRLDCRRLAVMLECGIAHSCLAL